MGYEQELGGWNHPEDRLTTLVVPENVTSTRTDVSLDCDSSFLCSDGLAFVVSLLHPAKMKQRHNIVCRNPVLPV